MSLLSVYVFLMRSWVRHRFDCLTELLGTLLLTLLLLMVTSSSGLAVQSADATTPVKVRGVATVDLAAYDALAAKLGSNRKPGQFTYFEQWSRKPAFDPRVPDAVIARGMTPELTWEPWDPAKPVTDPTYAPKRIAAGFFDPLVQRYAQQIKTWGKPLRIRFAQEMNGDWYPWGYTHASSTDYKRMYQHVVSIFKANGVANVTWVWAPNVLYHGENVLDWYPNSSTVDVVGMDGYNWGRSRSWTTWTSFEALFRPLYNQLTPLGKPIYVSETASTSVGGDKAAWITALRETINGPTMRLAGWTWFSFDKETDWRIDSSPASLAAYRAP